VQGATIRDKMSVRTMLVLVLPTLGFSTALSMVTTYLPVILMPKYTTSNTLVGFAIGGEGIFSALIPLWVGVFSDRMWTKRWGRRQPFMIFAGPFMAAALILAPFQPGYVPIAISTFVFFGAYHFYTSPYQSLIADVTPVNSAGKVQGYQASMRGAGMFLGMVVAGILFYRWAALPFILNGLMIIIFTYFTVARIREPEPELVFRPQRSGPFSEVKRIWRSTIENKPIRRFMVATFLWESTLAGLRPFMMLYFIYTLGSSTQIGALLYGLVGVTYIVAALASGYLADKYGRFLIMRIGLVVFFGGCLLGFFIRDIKWAFIFLPIFGLGGSIVLTLPYAILMGIMPKEHVGQFTGMFSMMRGLANIIAPVVAGAAIDIAKGHMKLGTQYSVVWLYSGLVILISLYFFRNTGRNATSV
jgi:maltose/moltooligosaccharide transporter